MAGREISALTVCGYSCISRMSSSSRIALAELGLAGIESAAKSSHWKFRGAQSTCNASQYYIIIMVNGFTLLLNLLAKSYTTTKDLC